MYSIAVPDQNMRAFGYNLSPTNPQMMRPYGAYQPGLQQLSQTGYPDFSQIQIPQTAHPYMGQMQQGEGYGGGYARQSPSLQQLAMMRYLRDRQRPQGPRPGPQQAPPAPQQAPPAPLPPNLAVATQGPVTTMPEYPDMSQMQRQGAAGSRPALQKLASTFPSNYPDMSQMRRPHGPRPGLENAIAAAPRYPDLSRMQRPYR